MTGGGAEGAENNLVTIWFSGDRQRWLVKTNQRFHRGSFMAAGAAVGWKVIESMAK